MQSETSGGIPSLRVVLVAGTPGTRTVIVVNKLLEWIKNERPEEFSRWRIADKFEKLLAEETGQELRDLLTSPKPMLRDYLNRTLERLRMHLDSLEGKDDLVVLLPIHLVWFHDQLREHIEVLDTAALRRAIAPHEVIHVLCLIDDIHDIYSRLRSSGGLYDRHAAPLSGTDARQGKAFLRHLEVLHWRSREIATAEAASNRLAPCPYTMLATKHQPSVAYYCLTGHEQVYLSHPISEVRRLERSQSEDNRKKATSIKDFLWPLQGRLARSHALLQPTTIDEWRIGTLERRVVLTERFYTLDRYSKTLFAADGCQGDDVIYDDLAETNETTRDLDLQIAKSRSEMVESFISNQVTARDLQLVTQAGCLIVFRPRFNGHLSNGVLREILYFIELNEFRDTEPKILLLDKSSDRELFLPRQFIETLLKTKQWNVALDGRNASDCLAQLSEETRASIRSCKSRDDVTRCITSVLRDIGLKTTWSLVKDSEHGPLKKGGGFIDQAGHLDMFLDEILGKLRPFEEKSPYTYCKIQYIDGLTVEELSEKISRFLTGLPEREIGQTRDRDLGPEQLEL